mmetsp:Transcript_24965/g.32592  ORF Transcript_24965/g.32592 Transcript_24965/m.32592 type:complete len:81 (-) Transcript_24965:371-613(-)
MPDLIWRKLRARNKFMASRIQLTVRGFVGVLDDMSVVGPPKEGHQYQDTDNVNLMNKSVRKKSAAPKAKSPHQQRICESI